MVGKGLFHVNIYSFFGCKGEWIFCCSGCVTIPVVNAGFAKERLTISVAKTRIGVVWLKNACTYFFL